MNFVARANRVRHHVPFVYWLAYDAVALPLMIWGLISLSWVFAVGLAMLLVAVFFDANEAIVKWGGR